MKKTSGGAVKNENISNKKLAEELQKPHSPFIDNIWGTDLADMQLIHELDKGFRFFIMYY